MTEVLDEGEKNTLERGVELCMTKIVSLLIMLLQNLNNVQSLIYEIVTSAEIIMIRSKIKQHTKNILVPFLN